MSPISAHLCFLSTRGLGDQRMKINQIQTCLPSADWDLPVGELLAECAQPCTASDSDNSDSESTSTESQSPLSLDRAQESIQEFRTFALHIGNGTFLDRVMDLQDMSVTIRMNQSLNQRKINAFLCNYIYIQMALF